MPLDSPEAADAARFGPKAANQAALGRAGLPIPDGFCLDAAAYRAQLAAIGMAERARAFVLEGTRAARLEANAIRLALFERPVAPSIREPLLAARAALAERGHGRLVVRSSALVEDRAGASFAGQFESFLGLDDEAELLTAVRACWAALWSTRALRYMAAHGIEPGATAMALLIQPLIAARASGGGLSRMADGGMVLTATWGLGEAIAQGEVVPDRYELDPDGRLGHVETGRKTHRAGCHRHEPAGSRAVPDAEVRARCLDDARVAELGGLLRKAEGVLGGPAEIEWALDDGGFKMLQVRPLQAGPAAVPDAIWLRHPGLKGHPAGIGWGAGRACVINCECELARVGPGDVLVTRVAGPSLAGILPRVVGVVAELGGSTSHLASLARERGIPMVLGVPEATRRIPDGARVAVDGVAGIVRWIAA